MSPIVAACASSVAPGLSAAAVRTSRQRQAAVSTTATRAARTAASHPLTQTASKSRPFSGVVGRRSSPGLSSSWVVAASDVDVDDALLEIEDDAMTRMDKCISKLKANFSTVRTGRATPNMLDRVEVKYYGEMTPLKSVAGISTPDASTLQIQPFDMSALQDIERAIMTSDLDLTPNNDGKVIRIRIPELTEERRKEMTKKVGALGEEGKVAIRNVRRDALKSLGKLSDASEDIVKGMETEIQKMTDSSIKQIDDLTASKNKELTTV